MQTRNNLEKIPANPPKTVNNEMRSMSSREKVY